jgi:hypothetical protein
MTMCVGLEVHLHSLLTSALYEGESSASLLMSLPGGGRSPDIHQLRRLVGFRARLDSGEKNFFLPQPGIEFLFLGCAAPRLKSKIFRFRQDRLN